MKTSSQNLSKLSVIYVEDEPIIAMDGQAMLEDMGFANVAVCYSLADAKAALEQQQKFDFGLLDINLGGGETSLGLARQLQDQGTPIVFASGYNPDEQIVAEFEVPLVVKPFDDAALGHAIRKSLCDGS